MKKISISLFMDHVILHHLIYSYSKAIEKTNETIDCAYTITIHPNLWQHIQIPMPREQNFDIEALIHKELLPLLPISKDNLIYTYHKHANRLNVRYISNANACRLLCLLPWKQNAKRFTTTEFILVTSLVVQATIIGFILINTNTHATQQNQLEAAKTLQQHNQKYKLLANHTNNLSLINSLNTLLNTENIFTRIDLQPPCLRLQGIPRHNKAINKLLMTLSIEKATITHNHIKNNSFDIQAHIK